MGAMASQITSLTIVYSTVYSGADQRKHQSSASLAFVWRIHRGPMNSPHKWPVTRKVFHLMTSSWWHQTSTLLSLCERSPPVTGRQNVITMTSQWAPWCLKSPPSGLFAQPFVQAHIRENIKAPRHCPWWGESIGDQWIPRTKGQ